MINGMARVRWSFVMAPLTMDIGLMTKSLASDDKFSPVVKSTKVNGKITSIMGKVSTIGLTDKSMKEAGKMARGKENASKL